MNLTVRRLTSRSEFNCNRRRRSRSVSMQSTTNPYEPTSSEPKGSCKASPSFWLCECGIIETLLVGAIIATMALAIGPVISSNRYPSWNQLPAPLLMPNPKIIGWTNYWLLCLPAGLAIGSLFPMLQYALLRLTYRQSTSPPMFKFLWSPVAAVIAFLLASGCHGGVPH